MSQFFLDSDSSTPSSPSTTTSQQDFLECFPDCKLIFNLFPVPLIFLSQQKIILHSNQASEKCFCYEPNTLIGLHINSIIPNNISKLFDLLDDPAFLNTQSPQEISIKISGKKKNGVLFPIEVLLNIITIKDLNYMVLFIKDITHKEACKKLKQYYQKQLLQIKKHDLLEEIGSVLSKDFNNLITGITSCSNLLLRNTSLTPETRDKTQKILEASRKARDLLQQLMKTSQCMPHLTLKTNLEIIIQDIMPKLQGLSQSRCEISLNIQKNLPQIMLHSSLIQRALESLVNNSIESLNSNNGKIIISISEGEKSYNGDESGYFGRPFKKDEYLQIKVSDNGCGIQKSNISKIFDPFYSTKFSSRGLGLSTVLETVKCHHGAAHISSTPSVGTDFCILLPIETSSQDSSTPTFSNYNCIKTMLLVNYSENQIPLANRLLSLGYKVEVSDNLKTAIKDFKRLNSDLSHVFFHLTDVSGKDLALLKEFKWLDPLIPIIVTTNLDLNEQTPDLKSYGVTYELQELIQSVEQLLLEFQIRSK